ncbi:MAG: MFS transporter [Geminicoccaceae bacterium]
MAGSEQPELEYDESVRPVPVAALGSICVLVACSFGILAPAIPVMIAEFGLSQSSASLLVTGASALIAISSLLAGSIVDRFSLRAVLYTGLATFVLGSLAGAFAQEASWLVAARLVQASGGAIAMTTARVAIRRAFDPAGTLRLLGIFAFFMVAVGVLASPAGGWLTEMGGWRMIFVVEAVFALGFWIFVARDLRGESRFENPATDDEMLRSWRARIGELRNAGYVSLVILHTASSALILAELIWIAQIGMDRLGMSPGEIGIWRTVLSVALAAGCIVPARLSARFDPRTFALAAAAVSAVGLVLFFAIATSATSAAGLFLPNALFAFSCGIVLALAPSWCMTICPGAPGTALGVMSFLVGLSSSAMIQTLVAFVGGDADRLLAAALIACCGLEILAATVLLVLVRGEPEGGMEKELLSTEAGDRSTSGPVAASQHRAA